MIFDKLSRSRFFQGIEISRAFLRAKEVREKRRNFQNPTKIMVLRDIMQKYPNEMNEIQKLLFCINLDYCHNQG